MRDRKTTNALMAALLAVAVMTVPKITDAADPQTVAREIGSAGQAAASAIARNASTAETIPGFAGTDLTQTGLGESDLEARGEAALADPLDPGGRAGRLTIDAASAGDEAAIDREGPVANRARGISTSPQAPAWQADGLASGEVSDCPQVPVGATPPPQCGSVAWCVGSDCESVASAPNRGFTEAATQLNLALGFTVDGTHDGQPVIFAGESRACRYSPWGLWDCCTGSGLGNSVVACTEAERELYHDRLAGTTHYLGTRCSKRTFFGVCVQRSRSWCVFGSKLGRIVHEEARPQLGIAWNTCRGFTANELERIDFGALDLEEFTDDLTARIALPDSGETRTRMQERIRNFYGSQTQ